MEIIHYFAPISGYAYLGIAALMEMAAKQGCSIVHAPVDIQAVFAASSVTPPAAQSAAKKKYRAADMKRWAARRSLPVNLQPKYWPANGVLAARYIIAAGELSGERGPMAQAVLEATWARDLDIANEDTMQLLSRELGLDANAMKEVASSAQTTGIAQQHTDDAIALGLFGSPTYLFADEMFFGQDRLDFLEQDIVKRKAMAMA